MTRRPPGKLRIIGGQWRSRIVEFDAGSGVRPTPDRVRQTLFDWLSPLIEGARCLDLFAGSGALGLEALSRGAAHVTFVDSDRGSLDHVALALAKLDAADRAQLVKLDALGFLGHPDSRPFDIVFLDPPYDSGLLPGVLQRLPPWLRPDNRVYVERRGAGELALPAGWHVLREKRAGQVSYALTTCTGDGA
jgi:16S rRNA (guanine966-N2)-methyltransferase